MAQQKIPDKCVEKVIKDIRATDLPYQKYLSTPEFKAAIPALFLDKPEGAGDRVALLMLFLGRARSIEAKDVIAASTVNWHDRVKEAVRRVRQAAEKLSDPIAKDQNKSIAEYLTETDAPASEWVSNGVSSYFLMRFAELLEDEAGLRDKDAELFRGGNVVPVSARQPFYQAAGVSLTSLGRTNTKPLLIRELNRRLPAALMIKRYSIVAGLMKLIGHPTTAKKARSAVMRGKTRKRT